MNAVTLGLRQQSGSENVIAVLLHDFDPIHITIPTHTQQ
jgi:hypothetical protein